MVFQFFFFLNKTSQVALSKANTFQYSEREQRRPCHVVELPYLPIRKSVHQEQPVTLLTNVLNHIKCYVYNANSKA